MLAVMDTDVLEAQHRQAKAQLNQASNSVETARSQLTQRESEAMAAQAVIAQRQAELDVARKRADRSSVLASEGATSQQEADDDIARVHSADAAVQRRPRPTGRRGGNRCNGPCRDYRRPVGRRGRTGYRRTNRGGHRRQRAQVPPRRPGAVPHRPTRRSPGSRRPGAQPGRPERCLHDLLPARAEAGRVALGSEVRIVLDAAPST